MSAGSMKDPERVGAKVTRENVTAVIRFGRPPQGMG